MTGDVFLSAAGASIATIAIILVASRLLFRRRPGRALELTVRWLRLPIHRVASLAGVLAMASALCFAKIADNSAAQVTANASGSPTFEELSNAPDGDLTSDSDKRQQDYERFRAYTNGLLTKMQTLPSSGLSSPVEDKQNLPDVDTMISRLVKRLEADSSNVDGWRMLGWSYLHTGKYAEAEHAYTTALSLDPNNADTKKALDEARASPKRGAPEMPISGDSDVRSETASKISSEEPDASAMGKEMTDRLATRLEAAPHDADGWLRLMRARTVLGQQDLAKDALRRALATFADDKSTRETIVGAAKEMGLNAN